MTDSRKGPDIFECIAMSMRDDFAARIVRISDRLPQMKAGSIQEIEAKKTIAMYRDIISAIKDHEELNAKSDEAA